MAILHPVGEPPVLEVSLEISLHPFVRDEVPHLMRVLGQLRAKPISMPVDTRSTHKFM